MAPKRKYGVLETSSESTRYELRERTAQGKLRRVTGKFEPSLQDPFYVLGDHEVRKIITLLEARDTEILRRVSRLWKASAEYHCAKSLLLQHFPWMATKLSQSATRDEWNLLFRRCLYHEESLRAGLATRAIKLRGAKEWHIHDDRIMWSNLGESTSIRLLGSSKASSSGNPEERRLNVQKFIPKDWHVDFVQPISKGEILVTAAIDRDFWQSVPRSHKLILVSLPGKVKWTADVDDPLIKPAIGRASLYLITRPMISHFAFLSDEKSCMLFFMKLSLSTGSIEVCRRLPIAAEIYGYRPISLSNESLVLSMDERYAMWVHRYVYLETQGPTDSHHIIRTTTGSLRHRFRNRSCPFPFMATTSIIVKHALWAYGYSRTWLTVRNPYDKSWATRHIRWPAARDPCCSRELGRTARLGFEGDRLLFSHLIQSKGSKNERWEPVGSPVDRTKIRTSKFAVSFAGTVAEDPIEGETTGSPDEEYTPCTASMVTLPDGDGGRRELEVKLPWTDRVVSFFGFVGGSIVYHSRRHEVLVLIEFWPDW